MCKNIVESNKDICKGLVVIFTAVGIVSLILFLVEKQGNFSSSDNKQKLLRQTWPI